MPTLHQIRLVLLLGIGLAGNAHAQQASPPDVAVAALYRACEAGDLDQVKTLVDAGTPINGQTGKHGSTPLIAAACNHLDVTAYLITKRAKLDIPDYDGNTPLLWACFNNKTSTALTLIASGANVDYPSNVGCRPLMYASMWGNDLVVTALLEHKVNFDANGSQGPAVLWAAIAGKLSTLKLLVAAGASLNLKLEGNLATDSILEYAASRNDLDMVNFLIDQKLNVDLCGDKGTTPLMAASEYHATKILERLLEVGANVNAQNVNGDTALMLATAADTSRILLQHHAKTELANAKGMTALMGAAAKNNLEKVQALVESGADIDASDTRGETALTIAGDQGAADVVQWLKDNGAKRTNVRIIPKDPPDHPLTPAQSWALALGAIYTQRDGYNPRVLGSGDTEEFAKRSLSSAWKVHDRASLATLLNGMNDRANAIIATNNLDKISSPLAADDSTEYLKGSVKKVSELMAKTSRDPLTFRPSVSLSEDKLPLKGFLDEKKRSGLAWTLGCSVNLINIGYAAHYIDQDEAWDRLMDIARTAQANFGSWQEFSTNFLDYELVLQMKDRRSVGCAQLLLLSSEANSPWNQNPWKTELPASVNSP